MGNSVCASIVADFFIVLDFITSPAITHEFKFVGTYVLTYAIVMTVRSIVIRMLRCTVFSYKPLTELTSFINLYPQVWANSGSCECGRFWRYAMKSNHCLSINLGEHHPLESIQQVLLPERWHKILVLLANHKRHLHRSICYYNQGIDMNLSPCQESGICRPHNWGNRC